MKKNAIVDKTAETQEAPDIDISYVILYSVPVKNY